MKNNRVRKRESVKAKWRNRKTERQKRGKQKL